MNKHDSCCLKKAADDEPIFVLRAQDATAPDVVRHWLRRNRKTLSEEKINDAYAIIDAMEKWPGRKYPD